jgi:hypothetical protein
MYERFFSADSFWNTPIGVNPETDPKNSDFLKLLERETGEGDRGFWINMNEWTIPVYEVDDTTPRRNVLKDTLKSSIDYSLGDCFENPAPIPDYARPDGSQDAHMALIDKKRRKAWDMWHVRQDGNGQWRSFTGMTYSLDGDGVFDPDKLAIEDGCSAHSRGLSRAAAVPAIAGLIMYDEIMAERIEHKLSFATWANGFCEFVYPARWTDGKVAGGIPEGCVIQLDPSLDLSRFNLSSAALTIARALQEYGAVNVDVAGGKAVYAENLNYCPAKSWNNILKPDDIAVIGMSNYRILKLENIIKKGDARVRRNPK